MSLTDLKVLLDLRLQLLIEINRKLALLADEDDDV